jgi:hypothetical protein
MPKRIEPLAGQLTGSNSRKTSADITILSPVVGDASPNRLPLLKEIATAVLDEQNDKSYFYPKPNVAERDKHFFEKTTVKKSLYPSLRSMFSATDRYLATLNNRLDEAEAAAKSCDRTRYDAAIKRLISA